MKLWKNNDGRTCVRLAVTVALALLICVVGNVLLGWIPYNTAHRDLTDRTTFSLSDATGSLLESIREDVTITFLCEGGVARLDPDLYAFLSRYADANGHITLRVADHTRNPELLAKYGVDAVSDQSIVVESARRFRVIDNAQLYYYFNSTYQLIMTPAQYDEYLAVCDEIDATGAFKAEFASLTVPYFDGEFCLTNAINFVTREDVTVAYTLIGNGAVTLDSSLSESMTTKCYDHRALSSLSAIPTDCELLIIYAPAKDLSDAEAQSLSGYLAGGGKLFLSTNYEVGVLPKLAAVLAEYGLGFGDPEAIVCDDQNTPYEGFFSAILGLSMPDPFLAYMTGPSIFGDMNLTFLSGLSHEIVLTPTDGVALSPLIKTGEQGYLARYDSEAEKWGKLCYDEANEKWVEDAEHIEHAVYCVGATAKRGETEILWISGATSMTPICNAYTEDGGNFLLFERASDSMGQNVNEGVMVSAKPFDVTALTPTSEQTSLWRVLLIFLIPFIPAGIGVFGMLSKRRK